jgi:ParB/RepB/Spo0J family partition protein
MNRQKKTVDFARLAAEAKADSTEMVQAAPVDELLQKLLKNIGKSVMLPTNLLIIKDNIRQIFDTSSKEFRQLVESVREKGVKQNLLGNLRVEEDGTWEIICAAGQRRLLAAREVGIEFLSVRLEQYPDEAAFIIDSLSENILRENLHTLDAALGYLRLFNLGWTPENIAESFERKRDTVMKMMRLARYPEQAKDIIKLHHEKFTSTILLTKFVSKKWPDDKTLIAALEDFAMRDHRRNLRPTITDHEVKYLETKVADKGVKAKSKGSKESGQITLSWASHDEFIEVHKILFSLEGN